MQASGCETSKGEKILFRALSFTVLQYVHTPHDRYLRSMATSVSYSKRALINDLDLNCSLMYDHDLKFLLMTW